MTLYMIHDESITLTMSVQRKHNAFLCCISCHWHIWPKIQLGVFHATNNLWNVSLGNASRTELKRTNWREWFVVLACHSGHEMLTESWKEHFLACCVPHSWLNWEHSPVQKIDFNVKWNKKFFFSLSTSWNKQKKNCESAAVWDNIACFRRGFCVLELENVAGGVYNIQPCTFYPGNEGPFILTVSASTQISLVQLQ